MSLGQEHDWFEYGIDRRRRTLYYGSVIHDEEWLSEGGTDYKSVGNLIKGLHLLESTSSAPITIYINNPGGIEYHMLAAYDAIRRCKSEVIAIVMGHAMSAASVILQAADTRLMAPSSWLMIHYGTWGYGEEHSKNLQRTAQHGKQLDRQMEDIYLERIREKHPKFSRQQLQNRLLFDYYLTAEETVEMGLADHVDAMHLS